MAYASKIDPEWQFQLNSVTRILEKAGATRVYIDKHTPRYPSGFILAVFTEKIGFEITGENLAHLTKVAKEKLESGILKKGQKK